MGLMGIMVYMEHRHAKIMTLDACRYIHNMNRRHVNRDIRQVYVHHIHVYMDPNRQYGPCSKIFEHRWIDMCRVQ